MADFNKRSDFNPRAKFTSVLFGANSPLLEVELNEMQQIAEAKRADILKLVTKAEGDKILYLAKEQVDSITSNMTTTITIAKLDMIYNNQIISVPAGNYSVPFLVSLVNNDIASYGDLYLAYKEEIATPATVLNQDAVRGATTLTNAILDTRFGAETTRRTLIKFGGIGSDTALATQVSEGYTLLKMLKVQKVNSLLTFTLYPEIGEFTLPPYPLVSSSGIPYNALSDLNSATLVSGFSLVNASTLNKPSAEEGTVLNLNKGITRTQIMFTNLGKIFFRTNTLSPVYASGTWVETSPTDIQNLVRGTLLTGLSLATGTAVTSADTVLVAIGKLQKQSTDDIAVLSSHTGNVSNPHSVTKAQVGLGSVDNTADSAKPVSTAQQTALNLKANLASPTFTGTVGGITKSMVGLANVDNTTDAGKPVSTAQQTALDLKANLASPTFTGTVGGITKAMVGLANVDNTLDSAKPVSTAQQTALDLKANLASPTFTGTVAGITKTMVGLSAVDNTADSAKPVSSAQQTALNLKANLASPTFTGTVGGITSAMVGLGNVQNLGLATQAEAEAGTLDTKYMTPLRVKQAMTVAIPTDTSQLAKTDVYTKLEVGTLLTGKSDWNHGHSISEVIGLQTSLDSKLANTGFTASMVMVTSLAGAPEVSAISTAKLGYLTDVTSNIQAQIAGKANSTHVHAIADVTSLQTSLDAKQVTITGGATTIATTNLTASRALVSDASGKVAVSSATSTQLGYLVGVTSAIQTQLDGKSTTGHTHAGSYLPMTGGTLSSDLSVTGLTTATGGLKIGSYKLTISTTAPISPSAGDVWVDI